MEEISKTMMLDNEIGIGIDDNGRVSLVKGYISNDKKQGKVWLRIEVQNEAATYFTTVGDIGEITAMMDAFTGELARKLQKAAVEQIGYMQSQNK